MQNFKVPRWYQELSIPQMQQVVALKEIIKRDYQEEVSVRTQRVLHDIGITSVFVKIPSKVIRSLHKSTQLDPALFLCEIYRHLTGNRFEDEGYKNVYDCNERLILSAITYLKLPEIIYELHKRLPFKKNLKHPPKPLIPKSSPRKLAKSPYLEPLFEIPDWRRYKKELEKWRETCKTIIKPQVILPPAYLLQKQDLPETNFAELHVEKKSKRNHQRKKIRQSKKKSNNNVFTSIPITDKFEDIKTKLEENTSLNQSLAMDEQLKEGREPDNRKPELVDDETNHESEEDNLEQIISTFQEKIEKKNTEENLIIDFNKSESLLKNKWLYGRENLSLKWQEWLCNVEDDYKSLEKEANCLLQGVREVIKDIYNPDLCDDCCACRQVRKSSIKKHTSKTPYLLLDSVATNGNGKKKIIDSLVLSSPPESLPDSWTNLPQIIPSKDKIVKKNIINGITIDEKGKVKYLISRVVKESLHTSKIINHLDPIIKNVPPCSCSQHELDAGAEDKDEFNCVENGICIAEKYRSNILSSCNKCSEDIAANKIFRDFEKACRNRENREKEALKPIDHQTCTQRFVKEEKIDVEKPEVQVVPEVVHPLIKFMNEIDREKNLGRSKVSKKSEIKEYKDKIRFAINSVVENVNDNNSDINNGCLMEKYVLSEVTMQSPKIITPESSASDLSDLVISPNQPHRHWSVTQFTPKPKPIEIKPKNKPRFRFDINKWREIVDQPFRKDIEELFEKVRNLNLQNQSLNDDKEKGSSRKTKKVQAKNSEAKKKYQSHNIQKNKEKSLVEPVIEKQIKMNNEKEQLKISRETIKKEKEETFDDFNKKSLIDLMKIALRKMAKEGFLLAKLPVCYNIPQLRMWIMYREGFILTEKQKHDLLEKNEKMWNLMEFKLQDKIVAPTIIINELGHEFFKYDNMKKLQAEIELKKKLFYNKVRKSRVLKSREMWNQMEFETFPSLAFKRAYFVYQPSKEADGYLKNPYGFNPS